MLTILKSLLFTRLCSPLHRNSLSCSLVKNIYKTKMLYIFQKVLITEESGSWLKAYVRFFQVWWNAIKKDLPSRPQGKRCPPQAGCMANALQSLKAVSVKNSATPSSLYISCPLPPPPKFHSQCSLIPRSLSENLGRDLPKAIFAEASVKGQGNTSNLKTHSPLWFSSQGFCSPSPLPTLGCYTLVQAPSKVRQPPCLLGSTWPSTGALIHEQKWDRGSQWFLQC